MTNDQFSKILDARVTAIRSTLSNKAKEYAVGDRLYNFNRAAEILRTTAEKALLGMFTKHLVSVIDLVEKSISVTEAVINEKLGDAINYLILLEAMLKESTEEFQVAQKALADRCPKCNGTGNDPQWRHGSVDDCDACKGTGKRDALTFQSHAGN